MRSKSDVKDLRKKEEGGDFEKFFEETAVARNSTSRGNDGTSHCTEGISTRFELNLNGTIS